MLKLLGLRQPQLQGQAFRRAMQSTGWKTKHEAHSHRHTSARMMVQTCADGVGIQIRGRGGGGQCCSFTQTADTTVTSSEEGRH